MNGGEDDRVPITFVGLTGWPCPDTFGHVLVADFSADNLTDWIA